VWQLDIGSNTVSNCNVILRIDGGALQVLDAYRPAPRGTRCMTTHT
jgi:hypothetical protein